MAAKVTFHPDTLLIEVTVAPVDGLVTLDFKIDVYSDGKEDWLVDSSLAVMEFPIEALGGNDLPGGLVLDTTFFINNGWKIQPYDADHELIINGNVFTDDGSQAVVPRAGRTITSRIVSTFSAGSSAADLGSSVLDTTVEGTYSLAETMRILLAVAAGKTTIVDLGGGLATITFRNTQDTVDRVVADMVDSERDTVTLNPN